MRYRLKHIVEYAGLRGLGLFLTALPYRAALGVGWCVAWLAFHVGRYRVARAETRLRQVFGDWFSPREVRRVAWLAWRNVVFSAVEMLRVSRMSREWVRSVTDCDDVIREFKAHARTGQGAVLALPHMGNWEMAAITCGFDGLPLFSIAAQQKNPLVNAYLNRLRGQFGAEIITRGAGTMKEVLRKLRAGQFLAILPDVRLRTPGVQVPFLGGVANVGTGMALFARHADVPIFPGVIKRQGWGRQVFVRYPAIRPDKNLDKEEDVKRMTLYVMKIIEEEIRRDPSQWFWFNKRWILDPL